MARKSLWNINRNISDKNSPAYMQQQYNVGRQSLLAAIVCTVINLVLLQMDYDLYFLFSISIPYYGAAIGQALGYELGMLLLAVAILAVYVVLYVLSKKHRGAIIAALVLMIADCFALMGLMIWLELFADITLDIIFHMLVILSLFQAIRYGKKLDSMGVDMEKPEYALYSGPVLDSSVESGFRPKNTGPEIGGKPEVKNRGPEID